MDMNTKADVTHLISWLQTYIRVQQAMKFPNESEYLRRDRLARMGNASEAMEILEAYHRGELVPAQEAVR